MNKYVNYYNRKTLEEIDFKKPGKKALIYGFSAIALGVFGCLLAPLANLNIYSEGNLFLAVVIGLVIFGICFIKKNLQFYVKSQLARI